jgi:glyoxylase-like metal-dependent hydrolase (beta-lactamase superfamily II)
VVIGLSSAAGAADGVQGQDRRAYPSGSNAMQWNIGAVKITKVVELELTGHTRFILPQATREAVRDIAWLYPAFADADGRLKMSIHSFLLETPTRRIIVDTGLGNDKEGRVVPRWNRLQGRFLEAITAAGYPPDTIDTVLLTHLHVDHVGWNTRLVAGRWVPTFPRARYLMGRVEFEHWRRRDHPAQAVVFEDSIQPIVDAGLADLIADDHRVCEEIRMMASPGHSPGHLCAEIQSGGNTALLIGDVMHHPCQMACLDWSTTADFDAAQADRTRRALLGRLAGTAVFILGGHFTGPGGGLVVRDGERFRLDL